MRVLTSSPIRNNASSSLYEAVDCVSVVDALAGAIVESIISVSSGVGGAEIDVAGLIEPPSGA